MNLKVTLKGCDSYADAQAWYPKQEIRLNLPKCHEYAIKFKIEFSEYVARCLNHEFLHHLLEDEQSCGTSNALDNIARKYKDYWMW